MKIQFLGTAAAEGVPAFFCTCPNCVKSRKLGGKNLRTRSQTIVDGNLLIDFNADSLGHFLKFGIDPTDIKNILITHVHDDHFYPEDLKYLRNGFSHIPDDFKINVYGSEDIENPLERIKDFANFSNTHLNVVSVKAFESFIAGEYKITPLPACHGTTNPFVYVIEKAGKSIFYCHDSGIPTEEVFEKIKALGVKFDLISLDCTEGANETIGYNLHMCLGFAKKVRERLNAQGSLSEGCKCILNHFSHNGLFGSYDEFKPIAENDGFITSYDGMTIHI